MNIFEDLFRPVTAETAGTPRVGRLADEPFEEQIRNAGSNVWDSLVNSVLSEGTAILRDTEAGKRVEGEATRQKLFELLPIIIIGVVVVFVLGMLVRRG